MHRSPVVAILGHVDHGKTTLLDYIRHSTLTSKEYGGITQKIGGYEIDSPISGYPVKKITFIDTPGHEAFSQLRVRGANVADVAVLLIDGKDAVMPQTIESISHIKAAKIPFIVAVNKIDLPGSTPDKVARDLLKYDVAVEGQGGHVPLVKISAKTGTGVRELLETILLLASDMNLKWDKSNRLRAYIIETKKDRRGVVVSAVVKDGELRVGDPVYCEQKKIKIRSLIDDQGRSIQSAVPAQPVEILGFDALPEVGTMITDQLGAAPAQKTEAAAPPAPFGIETILQASVSNQEKKLSLIVKTDSQGSLDAINQMLKQNARINFVLQAVGNIHKSDVFLAKTTGSIVIGFNIKPDPEVKQIAKQEKVIIKTYNIVYELIDELNEVADLLQEKATKEKNLKGEAKVVAQFMIEGEKVVGVKVNKGKLDLGDELEVYRSDQAIGKAKLVSLKIRAKKVKEVKKNQECGMILSTALDIRTNDVIKCIL
ncbi:translation initiation factor IF-2 [Patescibacteria group bacterium]|nr:translation initiation factor IF-2 [Patescibacteria group bacterium]MCL5091621.1 translation initiation factor IF-2 [Patescibacteria group bacterium]